MKKTAIILLAIIAAVILLFTGCDGKTGKDKETTTKAPAVTTTEERTTERDTRDSMMTSDREDASAGAPESTNQDSALGNAVEDAADGMADANERIADGVRDAEENNR